MAHEMNEMNEEERSWSDLPKDILVLIKSLLFCQDYNSFSSVCRSWKSSYPPVRSLPPPTNCPPCLIFVPYKNDMVKFFHPIYNSFYSMDIPQLYDAHIISSNYGWLLLSSGEKTIFFFNPFTREKIQLPDMPFKSVKSMCFTSSPLSSNCLVIGMRSCLHYMDIVLLRRGKKSWKTFYFQNENIGRFHCASNPVLFNSMYYVLGTNGNIGVFDPKNRSWEVLVIKPNELDENSLRRSFLFELGGKLVATFVFVDDSVQFSRLNLTNMVWETEEQGIGEDMLFLSSCSSFARRAVVNGMSNKIYFPIRGGTNGVFYSLKTKMYHSFAGGDYSSKNKMRRLPVISAWIEPSFKRSVDPQKLTW